MWYNCIELLTDEFSVTAPVTQLYDYLKGNNLRLLLFIDELQCVYSSHFSQQNAWDFIIALTSLADRRLAMWYIIVTGSSSVIRRLAFNKWTQKDKDKYINYITTDLNDTKLQPRYIYPMRTFMDFTELIKFCTPSTEQSVREQYIYTCGVPGVVVGHTGRYTLSAKGCEDHWIVKSLLKHTKSHRVDIQEDKKLTDEEKEIDSVFRRMEWVARDTILAEAPHNMPREQRLAELYDMADSSIVLYDEDRARVSFGTIRVFIDTVGNQTQLTVEIREQLAAYTHPMAEKHALRILCQQQQRIQDDAKKWLKVPVTDVSFATLSTVTHVEYNVLYKDSTPSGSDEYGTDGVIFEQSPTTGGVTAHCIQLKLGSKRIRATGKDSLQTIVNKWSNTKQTASKLYANLFNIPDITMKYYLVATKQVDQKGTRFPANINSIYSILDKGTLQRLDAWPDEVKMLHKMYM